MANFCSIFYFQMQHLKCCQNALEVSNLVKTCLLLPVLTWESLSFKFQTHNSNLLEQHFWTIFNMENCSIFVVFSDSPDASEKIDFMSFLWSARLVEIYSKTSFVKNVHIFDTFQCSILFRSCYEKFKIHNQFCIFIRKLNIFLYHY